MALISLMLFNVENMLNIHIFGPHLLAVHVSPFALS